MPNWKIFYKFLIDHKKFLLGFTIFLLTFFAFLSILSIRIKNVSPFQSSLIDQKEFVAFQSDDNVLGVDMGRGQSPHITISGSQEYYNLGGMIALASTDEPAIIIGGDGAVVEIEILLYEANESSLLEYLVHDKEGKQLYKNPDVGKFNFITTVKHIIPNVSYSGSKVLLPLGETGIWYVKVMAGSRQADAFILRSNIGVLVKEGDDELIFWGQNFQTKRSVASGTIKLLDLEDGVKEIQRASFNADGIGKARLTAEASIALVEYNADRVVVPLNLRGLNINSGGYTYKHFLPKERLTRYFIFTDRPLYKPGDIVYYKAVLRDDDDARYSVPSGQASVRIYKGYYFDGANMQPEHETIIPITQDGTISGQYKIPSDGKIGHYTLAVSIQNQSNKTDRWSGEWVSNTISFSVEYFRKPEFSIDITVPKTEFIAGDTTSFKIHGAHFSGQPLKGQEVTYVVHASTFYEYQYLTDYEHLSSTISDAYRYGVWRGNKVMEGRVTLDERGEAEIALETKTAFNQGKSQVFSIEAIVGDGGQNPAFSRKNILVYAGEYGIYRTDVSYSAKVNTQLTLPIKLVPIKGNTNIGNISLTAKVHRVNWIPHQDSNQKYPSYRKEEEFLPNLSAKTNKDGNTEFIFTPIKIGSYTITVEGSDSRGNLIAKAFSLYVSSYDQPAFSEGENAYIKVSTDKQQYNPNDIARVTLFSEIPDRDVFFSLERGRVNRFQIVRLNGKVASFDIQLLPTDVPNIFAEASSFSNSWLDTNQTNISVSSQSKRLAVTLAPNSQSFGPGETVTMNIVTTDSGGNPVSADVAVWAVDKAIFELSESKLGDIFNTFWKERYDTTRTAHSLESILVQDFGGGGGCFVSGTTILMADGTKKPIEQIKAGEYVLTKANLTDDALVKAKVIKTTQAKESGYLILNQNLKVTADHKLWVNNEWKEAGSVQIGDILLGENGESIRVNSIEWQQEIVSVHNLEIESYHTYFANGVWVHNDKGGARNVFKDTAYWNPSVRTDASGRAQVRFKLPDNLTTWTVAAVASTADTRVGQATNEIVVTKSIIVRPILPNILREGDEIVVSALVQNSTEEDYVFDVDLTFDSGIVEEEDREDLFIKSNDMQTVRWRVKPIKENDKAKLVFSAKARSNARLADRVTQEIPVRSSGFEERRGESGQGEKTFMITLASGIDLNKSSVSLYLSPTILGSLTPSMEYLIQYPYGCVEQITSSFVPAVIANQHSAMFGDALKEKDFMGIIRKGIARLSSQQREDGGWTWWFTGKSDPFITSYVVEYLLQAKQVGATVDENILRRAKLYLEQENDYDSSSGRQKPFSKDDIVAKTYGLTLLGAKDKVKRLTDFNGMNPDVLALAVMANYLNGYTDPRTNGLSYLISLAKEQGDSIFWEAGNKSIFGSKDASTALAIRAILLAGGDRELALKGARYLVRSRTFDYWSNTYATSQVIRALVELSKVTGELSPNYKYTVMLDGKTIAQGSISNAKQAIKEIGIPVRDIKPEGSRLSIAKDGNGEIYSTLRIVEFHTDRNAKAMNRGLTVKRAYVNEKGPEYTLGVGDIVLVNITVGGLQANEYYGVIHDVLPAGLVPINESFYNEQYWSNPTPINTSEDIVDKEVTENGMILSLYRVPSGERTYTYKARVTSEGTFLVPPATASLMYAPEIHGRSDAEILHIAYESQFIPKSQSLLQEVIASQFAQGISVRNILLGFGVGGLIMLVLTGILLKKKGIAFSSIFHYIRVLRKQHSSSLQQEEKNDGYENHNI